MQLIAFMNANLVMMAHSGCGKSIRPKSLPVLDVDTVLSCVLSAVYFLFLYFVSICAFLIHTKNFLQRLPTGVQETFYRVGQKRGLSV